MKSNIEVNPLNLFLIAYFYILEKDLNSRENLLAKIKFQSEESNTDEYLKRYFQKYLLTKNKLVNTDFEELSLVIDDKVFNIKIKELQSFKISSVFLPEQLTDKQKKRIAASKKSIYTNPDLFLKISNGTNTFFESLELKSTKGNNIPGSSVQQVSPFEWVVFVKRGAKDVSVATGYYINSITEKLPFPDRSPRPQISFKTLQSWNNTYRKMEQNKLIVESTTSLNQTKIKLLNDWQDYLASEWLAIIKSDSVKSNEKWFNNALRKFALKFLEHTDNLSKIEINELKRKLNSLIK